MRQHNASGVLIIQGDDAIAHLYGDKTELLHGTVPGAAENPVAVEFFDTAGQRLVPAFDRGWKLVDLVPAAERPDPELVLRRLRATVRNMRAYLCANEDLVEKAGLKVEDGLALLPEPRTVSLEVALQSCSRIMGHPGKTDIADPWHNFWVHGIL